MSIKLKTGAQTQILDLDFLVEVILKAKKYVYNHILKPSEGGLSWRMLTSFFPKVVEFTKEATIETAEAELKMYSKHLHSILCNILCV